MTRGWSKGALLASVLPAYGAVHESLSTVPFGWTQTSRAVNDQTVVQLQVALSYQNIDQLDSKLAAVSTPSSPQYGHYLDIDDLQAMFAPSTQAENQVKAWLQQAGATSISTSMGVISFTSTVSKLNSMLNTTFSVYSNGNVDMLRTMQYSVPDSLSDLIDVISPTTYFGNAKTQRGNTKTQRPVSVKKRGRIQNQEKRALQKSCFKYVTYELTSGGNETFQLIGPDCLKGLYNVGDYKPDPKSGSSIAFGSFLNESASYSDLAIFEQIYNLPSQNFTVLALINGGVDNQDPNTEMDGEANLDVQNIIGLVGGLPVGEYITGGSPPFIPDLLSPTQADNQNEPYLQYYQYLLSQPNSNLPYVISNSYGDHENTVPIRYAKRVCRMIGFLGLRGRTILESSGDEGVGAVCRANTGAKKPEFTPQFPATCPYVTAVGGTQFYTPEYAWNASSGGFSNYFEIPFYQSDSISNYLKGHIQKEAKQYYTENNYVNFSGRGFPDISAHSLYPDYLTVIDGGPQPNGGTSAASPVVAAIIALLNDARFRANLPAMGFINPWLYSTASKTLNDIVQGASAGCTGVDLQNGEVIPGAGIIPYSSWNASVSWDPVTGLGTPNFQKMKAVALNQS